MKTTRTTQVRKMNDAVVTVTPVLKDHGRYKETLRSCNRQGDIWVSPQLASGGADDETPAAKETEPKAITSDIATSSVLQVAGLVAQLVIQYPKESPAEIKSRILRKGLKQSWRGYPDRYILELPIKDIGLFKQIPLDNEGHASPFGTSAPSSPKSLPHDMPSTRSPLTALFEPTSPELPSNTTKELSRGNGNPLPPVRPSNIRPLSRARRLKLLSNASDKSPPDVDVLPGTANLRGLKRPHDSVDSDHGNER
ncbi:hypothetical protein H0H93_001383 [Arthromyces matolae]|nr:hypothetical protein H0H93_001383 [Arthromyces matolae]